MLRYEVLIDPRIFQSFLISGQGCITKYEGSKSVCMSYIYCVFSVLWCLKTFEKNISHWVCVQDVLV